MVSYSEYKKPIRVFVSYSYEDKEIADKIFHKLKERKKFYINNFFEISIGDTFDKTLKQDITSNDFILLLITKNFVESPWIKNEFTDNFLQELDYRDITLIPIVMNKTPIPEIFSKYQYFSFSNKFENQIDALITQIENIPDIDFSKLTPQTFEKLIFDLLRKLKFKEIQKENRGYDRNFDIIAEYRYKDPFGKDIYESWLIEIKYYSEDRVRLETIDNFRRHLWELRELDVKYKGLLITNGKLSSTILNKIDHYNERGEITLKLIDGTELKRLLLKNDSLIKKYFDNMVRS